jgi:hypothetical protein
MRGSAQTPSPKEKLLTNVFWKSYCAAVVPCSPCNGERVIVSTLCAELSRKDLNSDSLLPLFGQGAGVPYGCGMGRLSGETMAKLLDELGRGSKPAIPPSFSPCPLALADRDRREALRDQQSLTAAFFGDPLPGMSALDRRERERPH